MRVRKLRMSTSGRTILATLGFVAVSFVVMIIIVVNILFSSNIERLKRADTESANRLTASIKDSFDNTARFLSLAQQSFAELDLYDDHAHESIGKILTTLLELNPDAHSAWVVVEPGIHHEDRHCITEYLQLDGSIIAYNATKIGGYLETPESAQWYFAPLQNGKAHIETLRQYVYGNGHGHGTVYFATISVPIVANGSIIGVCGIDVSYKDMIDLLPLQDKQDRVVILLTRNMTVLHAADSELIGRNLADFAYADYVGMRRAIAGGELYVKELEGIKTRERSLVYLQPIRAGFNGNQESLYLLIGTPLSALFADTYNIVYLLVTTSLICMVFILAITFLNIRRLIKPIHTLTRQAQQITQGDYGVEIFGPADAKADEKNEVAVLRNAFKRVMYELNDNLHTVEKRVQERTHELTKLNKYIKKLMESTTNVSILMDRNCHVLYCSDNLLPLLRVGDFSDIKGVSWGSILDKFPDPHYAARGRQRLNRILSGETRFVEDDSMVWLDGSSHLYRIIYSQVRDDDDNLEGIVIVMLDLTDVRQEEAQRRQDDMMHKTTVPCFVLNEKGEIVATNDAFVRVFELPADISPEETDTIFPLIQPEFQPDGMRTDELRCSMIDSAIKDGFSQTNVQLRKYDGTPVYMLINAARISWAFDQRLVVYFHDRTDLLLREAEVRESLERERELRLENEAALAASEAKSQFLANMSHEIRTPMNAVLGMSELLLQENLNDRQSRYVSDIRTSAEALLEIINDILDVAKIQSGKLSLLPVHFDFGLMIGNISSIVRFIVEDKGVSYVPEIKGELPECIYGDDVRLRQVLLNLLGNAVKFTKAGNVKLTVSTTAESIFFEVRDSGIGIKEEDIEKLFGAFEQFDSQRNRDKTGTGLGLSITKALVELMGGSISVESVYGEGSSFLIEIPLVLGDKSQIRRADGSDVVIYAPEARILVVDDNSINLNVARGLLQLCGITAETASSGRQAIDLVSANDYDIVFMDQMMPEMDGLETTGVIRGSGIETPIIALTACAILGTKERMLEAGMDDYLTKPIVSSQLKQMLLKWLPAEKQQRPPSLPDATVGGGPDSGGGPDPGDALFWERIGRIGGLSMSVGLDRVDGQREVYRSILRLMLKEVEKCDRNLSAFLADGDMDNFRIEVHSMKGSLANIGVAELSDKAYALELASGEDDIPYCAANLPPLLQELDGLSRQIAEAFALGSAGDEPADVPPELHPIFESLTEAFHETDIIVIDECLEQLAALSLTGSLGDEIEQLTDAVIMTDFDFAREIMRRLIA